MDCEEKDFQKKLDCKKIDFKKKTLMDLWKWIFIKKL